MAIVYGIVTGKKEEANALIFLLVSQKMERLFWMFEDISWS